MKRLTLLVCLVAVPLAIFATAHEPYQGDFDLDGDVDFTDFLTFASNYGKTGGSTTPSTRVDTVWVTRVDTVQIFVPVNIDSGDNQGTQTDSLIAPPGLASLKIDGTTVPTGWRIKVAYLDFFGDRISTTLAVPKWRNPDKITVIIIGKTTNREFYRFDNVIYRSVSYPFDPLEILIPKTEISDIYDDRHFYIVRVVVEFDGVKYSGESL